MWRPLIFACLLSTAAYAEDDQPTTLFVPTVSSMVITLDSQAKAYVTIHPDGTIEYSKDYTPDAAADAFWKAIGAHKPDKDCK